MGFTTLQNTQVTIDLRVQGNSRGWSIDGTDAVHEACNAGYITLVDYPITVGKSYEFSYQIKSINTGNVSPRLGGVLGTQRTTTGFFTETITANTTGFLEFYSNANARISIVNVREVAVAINPKAQDTIVWSEKNNRWSDWRTLNPDCGYSMFANLFTHYNGQQYAHSADYGRNEFYGTPYKSIINFVGNSAVMEPKTFQALSYKGSQLMITTTDGITTSLGQISELNEIDFLKDTLDDGVTQVNIYSVEGIFSAGFMKAKPDIINGDVLKGNYITIELMSTGTGFLRLSNVTIHSEKSAIGSR